MEYSGRVSDADDAQHGYAQEIQHHDRPEHSRHAVGPATLDGKQQDEDDYRQRYDDGFKSGIYDRKTLDRRQHRNRRSDHAVAIKRSEEHTSDIQYTKRLS